jgi:hypothetical protein
LTVNMKIDPITIKPLLLIQHVPLLSRKDLFAD